MAMAHRLYHSVYFTLEDQADVKLLGWILAIPPSRRGRVLKTVLREALPRYLKRHHPGLLPLPPAAVPAAVEQTRQSRRQRLHTTRPSRAAGTAGPPGLAPPRGDGDLHPPAEASVVMSSPVSETERRQEAERKLDRLLRSLTK